MLSMPNLSVLVFKLLQVFREFLNFSISSNLSTLDFKLANTVFLEKADLSIPVAVFRFVFIA